MTIEQYKNKFTKAQAKKSLLEGTIAELSITEKLLQNRTAVIEEFAIFAQGIAKETQEKVKFQLEDIVNMALNAVYGPVYKFGIEFNIKRGNSEASLVLFKNEERIDDPMGSTGGGVCDILSFSLRIALLIISKNQKVLILDEPLKFISKDVKEDAIEIIKRINADLGIQIICITHDEELIDISDKVFKVSQIDGVSQVEEIHA
jgi:DNA repair exonuclease SbcCD ATPase subunit